jgi:hypothetical protein
MEKNMKRIIFLFTISVLILSASDYAQNQSTRVEEQHHVKYLKSHLNQIEENILKSFESSNPGVVASSAMTVRELEQIFPDEKFNSFIDPLAKIVQDEKAETQTRLLAALALDLLHSDKGDESIYYAAKYTNNNSVKDLCNCLSIEGLKTNLADKNYH